MLLAESCADSVEVSILLTNDAGITDLNREYRGIDTPTDVLSFSQVEGEDVSAAPGEPVLLGDVVISVETAQRQAMERGCALEDEMEVLLAHGLLHLLGYDHADRSRNAYVCEQEEILRPGKGQRHSAWSVIKNPMNGFSTRLGRGQVVRTQRHMRFHFCSGLCRMLPGANLAGLRRCCCCLP